MIDILVMYPNRDGMTFDEGYYLNHHIPLAMRLLDDYGLKFIRVAKGAEHDSPFYLVTYMGFETKEVFNKAIDEVGSEIFEDISKFTNVEPLIQVGEPVVNDRMP
ncbi:hypothetical protein L861_11275 [Litchfieldella anticariensis FP35 = DSM 16096]|uniref:EthD domain-containing protein n=1 Tax=Litchfieldella anticariensis (strain DSM 16096 / CECT 5854 / CIP 108499 / LMG 22089 / FP35) TaxID=1121939 RepID=S2KL37_LITA3|nr:EthD family reductase [Halomonas anticariensis]EPC01148.1 hypothetical protein L861_11275 [Halomonas anticariensis FP35 = DSM 16096]